MVLGPSASFNAPLPALLAVAVSILRLKPKHLTSPEFLTLLRRVIPTNDHLRNLKPLEFYRQLAAFSSSTFLELQLRLQKETISAEKDEPIAEEPNGGKAHNSKKRKGTANSRQTDGGCLKKKRKSELPKTCRPPATLKPYAPLIQGYCKQVTIPSDDANRLPGTPLLQKAICLLKSYSTPERLIEGLEVLTPFFSDQLSKLWTGHLAPSSNDDTNGKPQKPRAKHPPKQQVKFPNGSVGELHKAVDSLIKLVIQSIDGLSSLHPDSKEGQAVCLSSISFFRAVISCIYHNSITVVHARSIGNNRVLDIRNVLVEAVVSALSRLRSTVSVQRTILEGLIAMLLDSASIFMFFPVRFREGDPKAHDLDYGKRLWEEAGRYFLRLLTIAISAMETRVLPQAKQECQVWMLSARERLQERLVMAVLASIKQEDAILKRRDMSLDDFSSDINADYVSEVWALLGIETVASLASDPNEGG
jgi:hypothetical protein